MDETSMGTCYSQYTLCYWFIGFGEYNLRIAQKSVKKCDQFSLYMYLTTWTFVFSKKCPENPNLFLNPWGYLIVLLQSLD